jgi:hypothetical protein
MAALLAAGALDQRATATSSAMKPGIIAAAIRDCHADP